MQFRSHAPPNITLLQLLLVGWFAERFCSISAVAAICLPRTLPTALLLLPGWLVVGCCLQAAAAAAAAAACRPRLVC
jgi:hypothetical protein